MKLRSDWHELAAKLIRKDLSSLQVSERAAAQRLGMPPSTFNAFLNLQNRTAHSQTISKLLESPFWSETTRQALQELRDYDGTISRESENMDTPLQTVEDHTFVDRQSYHAGIPKDVLRMSRDGMFPEEWCAEIGISMHTLTLWANDQPELQEALRSAWHILHAYWTRLLRENLKNPNFHHATALEIMAKRFPRTWGADPDGALEHFEVRKSTSLNVDEAERTEASEGAAPVTIHSSAGYRAVSAFIQFPRTICIQIFDKGRIISFSEWLHLLGSNVYFQHFFITIFKKCGYANYTWEVPSISIESINTKFEFVIHQIPNSQTTPDRHIYSEYFDIENGSDGIVAFDNLGRDALLVVPSPHHPDSNYAGLPQFFEEAPIGQQLALWEETARHVLARISNRPIWISVAGGGINWLHIRLDTTPKYYRHSPYRVAR